MATACKTGLLHSFGLGADHGRDSKALDECFAICKSILEIFFVLHFAFCSPCGGRILMGMNRFVILAQQWVCVHWRAVNDGSSYLRGCLPDGQVGGQAPGGLARAWQWPPVHQWTQPRYGGRNSAHFGHQLFAPWPATPYGSRPACNES